MSTPPLAPLSDANRADYSKARSQAYTAASADLRAAHLDEYNRFVKKHMAEAGFDWSPRPTGKDRTLEQIRVLAARAGLGVDEVAAALVPEDGEATTAGE